MSQECIQESSRATSPTCSINESLMTATARSLAADVSFPRVICQRLKLHCAKPDGWRKPMPSDRATLTPPQFARRYGVGVAKVLAWISQNELRAINVVSEAGKRPRWVILPDAVE